jgi:hypothetical protein
MAGWPVKCPQKNERVKKLSSIFMFHFSSVKSQKEEILINNNKNSWEYLCKYGCPPYNKSFR